MELTGKYDEKRQANQKAVGLLISLSIVGVIINLVPAKIVEALGLPIWIDTIGTVLSAYLGGYLPAILAGLISNFIKGVGDTTSVYYAAINVMIAVSAAFFARRGFLDKIYKAVVLALFLAMVGGGLGGIVPWIMAGFPTRGFLTDLMIDVVDKLITVAVVYVILMFLPEKYKNNLQVKMWYQKPLTLDEEKQVKKTHCRRMSLRIKVLNIMIVALVCLAVFSIVISFIIFKSYMMDRYTEEVSHLSRTAAETVDPSKTDVFMEQGDTSEEYLEEEDILISMRDSTPRAQDLFVYQINEDGCSVVFDLDTDNRKGALAGETIEFNKYLAPYSEKILSGEEIEPVISCESYGKMLTFYTPIKNSDVVLYVGASVSLAELESEEISFVGQTIIMLLGFVLLIMAVVIFMVDYGIIYPLNSMALATEDMKYEEKSLEKGMEVLGNLDIYTGDEVENLYNHLVMMTEKGVAFINEIQEKNKTISTMQNALIMVLADIVESRDQNTGQHIRKTAAYVEVILRKMRELGIDSDIIDDEYIENMVHSAPLHDIGKIEVPDAVLNKPGKLDDFEFEIMKSHVDSGGNIIERVIKEVPNASYLGVAKELAEYHHEKWNGKGYPHRVKETEIPLSARVMAVADVLDALVSKRIYKPAMPFEKAYSIIEEDSGTHFDPDVVKAFVAAKDEIRAIEERFEREELERESR
ncbi:MAG: HD domain-containing protein [Lachnospiraceae bacterium]|nr:HD domain-containing protein [Lachnospiraceae bacterium]